MVLNGIFGFVQEFRAERALQALQQLSAPHVQSVRDGKAGVVSEAELVPGDIVLLEAGNVVPADLRIVETANLNVDEAALTGESQPIPKAGRGRAGTRYRDRRSDQHVVQRYACNKRADQMRCRRYRGQNGAWPDRGTDACEGPTANAATTEAGDLRPSPIGRSAGNMRHRFRAWIDPRRTCFADASYCGQLGGRGCSRGPAGGRDDRAGTGSQTNGCAQRTGAATAGRRDIGLGHRHLL